MTTMIEVSLDDLSGRALDWATGQALGWVSYPEDSVECGDLWHTDPSRAPHGPVIQTSVWRPSSNRVQAFDLMVEHIAGIDRCCGDGGFYARHKLRTCDGDQQYGETLQVAICRAVVFAGCGRRVSVPLRLVAKP